MSSHLIVNRIIKGLTILVAAAGALCCLWLTESYGLSKGNGNAFYLISALKLKSVLSGIDPWSSSLQFSPLRISLDHFVAWLGWQLTGDYRATWYLVSLAVCLATFAVSWKWVSELRSAWQFPLFILLWVLPIRYSTLSMLTTYNSPRALAIFAMFPLALLTGYKYRNWKTDWPRWAFVFVAFAACHVLMLLQFLTILPMLLLLLYRRPTHSLLRRLAPVAGFYFLASLALWLLPMDLSLSTPTYYGDRKFWVESFYGLYPVLKLWPEKTFLSYFYDFRWALASWAVLQFLLRRSSKISVSIRQLNDFNTILLLGGCAYFFLIFASPFGVLLGKIFTYGVVSEITNAEGALPLAFALSMSVVLLIAALIEMFVANERASLATCLIFSSLVLGYFIRTVKASFPPLPPEDSVPAIMKELSPLLRQTDAQCTLISDPFLSMVLPLATHCSVETANLNFLVHTPGKVIEDCYPIYSGTDTARGCNQSGRYYLVLRKNFASEIFDAVFFEFRFRFNPTPAAFQDSKYGDFKATKLGDTENFSLLLLESGKREEAASSH